MPYSTKQIKVDFDGKPIPQYFNPVADDFEDLQGANGASRVLLYDADGNPLLTSTNKGHVRATELESRLDALNEKIDGILDGSTPASTQLTGRDVTRVKLFDALAITDTTQQISSVINLHYYKKVSLVAINTLNQPVDVWFRMPGQGNVVRHWDGAAWVVLESTKKAALPTGNANAYYLNTFWTFLDDVPVVSVRMSAQCSVAPTSGSLTVEAWGVPN